MPEGDTVHKLVRALQPLLVGHELEALWLRDRGEVGLLRGESVTELSALGKHMLFAIGPGWVLHVHLGMWGRWERYRRGERWRRSPAAASAALTVDDRVFVVFRARIAELIRRPDLVGNPTLSKLGPDLLAPAPSLERIVRRARLRGHCSAADLLLDQRVACGLGNVYKSEVLFVERVHPSTPTSLLDDGEIAALYRRGRTLLEMNLGGWPRTTTHPVRPGRRPHEPRLWVYGRAGAPCLRCGTAVRGARHGDQARSSAWCASCQPERRASRTLR